MTILLSVFSIAMIYAMGCKWKYAPLLGIFTQIFWIIFVIETGQYGLMVGVLGYLIVHIINAYKWMFRLKSDF